MEEASTERQKRIAERTAASKSKVAVSANSEAKKLSSPKVGPTNTAKGLGAPDRRNKWGSDLSKCDQLKKNKI